MLGSDGVEEVALVFGAVAGFVELGLRQLLEESGVVPGGEVRAAQAAHVFECHAELDLAVAEHVRVRSAAGTLLIEEVVEDAVTVLFCEAHPVQRDIELSSDGTRVLEVLGRGAIGVVFVFPVAHEQRPGRPSLAP